MKMIFNFLRRPLAQNLPYWLATLALVLGVTTERAAAQATYYTPRALLGEFFPKSQLVTYKKYDLTVEQRAHIEQKIGYALKKPSYTFYVAKTGETVDGYAIIDEEMGQHLPITYGVKLSPRGTVERQEILVYRARLNGLSFE